MRIFVIIWISVSSLMFARRDCLQQAELDALGRSSRPEKDTFAISPSSHFYIHYDTTGNTAPDLTDIDGNGTPDYVDEVGIIADAARKVLVEIMDFQRAPFDADSIYDIFIMFYAPGVYGFNYKDSPSQGVEGATSYVLIDNDYIGFDSKFDLTPIEIMRISMAHEYFHGIQWGYEKNPGINTYFYEMTSMWFEDVIIPDGNDYLDGWADELLENPTADFDNTGGGYELALFGHYLSSFIDEKGIDDGTQSTILREIWERIRDSNNSAYISVKYILENNYNWDFAEAWIDFISRNLYNGMYEDMDNPFYYYIDQALINPIQIDAPQTDAPQILDDNLSLSLSLDYKSASILSYKIDELASKIELFHSDDIYVGRMAIISDNPTMNDLFWIMDTTTIGVNLKDEVHLFYGTDNSSTDIDIDIKIYCEDTNDNITFVDACGVCGGDNSSCMLPSFSLKDLNPQSPTYDTNISPKDYLGKAVLYYFPFSET